LRFLFVGVMATAGSAVLEELLRHLLRRDEVALSVAGTRTFARSLEAGGVRRVKT
jgi:hypothetical protein